VYANFGEITQSIRCPVRTPVFLLTKTFLSQGFIGGFRGRFESLARVLSSRRQVCLRPAYPPTRVRALYGTRDAVLDRLASAQIREAAIQGEEGL